MEAEPHLWAGSLDYVINLSFSFQGQKGDPGFSPGKARNGQKVRCCPDCTGIETMVRFKPCAHGGSPYCSHKHHSYSGRLRTEN